jgi:hypothetical protein
VGSLWTLDAYTIPRLPLHFTLFLFFGESLRRGLLDYLTTVLIHRSDYCFLS